MPGWNVLPAGGRASCGLVASCLASMGGNAPISCCLFAACFCAICCWIYSGLAGGVGGVAMRAGAGRPTGSLPLAAVAVRSLTTNKIIKLIVSKRITLFMLKRIFITHLLKF